MIWFVTNDSHNPARACFQVRRKSTRRSNYRQNSYSCRHLLFFDLLTPLKGRQQCAHVQSVLGRRGRSPNEDHPSQVRKMHRTHRPLTNRCLYARINQELPRPRLVSFRKRQGKRSKNTPCSQAFSAPRTVLSPNQSGQDHSSVFCFYKVGYGTCASPPLPPPRFLLCSSRAQRQHPLHGVGSMTSLQISNFLLLEVKLDTLHSTSAPVLPGMPNKTRVPETKNNITKHKNPSILYNPPLLRVRAAPDGTKSTRGVKVAFSKPERRYLASSALNETRADRVKKSGRGKHEIAPPPPHTHAFSCFQPPPPPSTTIMWT